MPELKDISQNKAWAVWVTGLPGCGKSTVSKGLLDIFRREGIDIRYLSMDERRKFYIQEPEYTEEERDKAYDMFVSEALEIVNDGGCVIMDGSGYSARWRAKARTIIINFAEVYLKCSVETAMKRERQRPQGIIMAGLYKKALERKYTGKEFEGLGEVIGVDVEFEENEDAECIVLAEDVNIDYVVEKVFSCLEKWLSTKKII